MVIFDVLRVEIRDNDIRGHEMKSRTVVGWLVVVNQFATMFEESFTPLRS